MLIALAFAHFSSELLLKEQRIIPVKKMLNNGGHIDAKLIDFSEICQKKSSQIGCFLLIVSWQSFPPKFPVKAADFSKNLPLKILWNLIFFPLKSREIGLLFCEFLTFLPRKSRKISQFSTNFDFFPTKIPWNRPIFPWICPWKSREILLFFSAKYQKPWIKTEYGSFCQQTVVQSTK